MNPRLEGVLLVSVALLIAAGVDAADPAPNSEVSTNQMREAAIEAARGELDAAAKRLADLHRQSGDSVQFFSRAGVAREGGRPMLGVLIGEHKGDGISVAGVTPGSGADAAGLRSGDILIAVDGMPLLGSESTLVDVLRGHAVEDHVVVEYERDGNRQSAEVVLGMGGSGWAMADPAAFDIAVAPTSAGMLPGPWQLQFIDLDADLGAYFGVDSGVLVLRASNEDGLHSGDVVQAIAGVAPANAAAAEHQLLTANGEVAADLLRSGQAMRVQVDSREVAAGPEMALPHGGVFRETRIEIRSREEVAPEAGVHVEED